jgi:hypothetical protein
MHGQQDDSLVAGFQSRILLWKGEIPAEHLSLGNAAQLSLVIPQTADHRLSA